MRPTTIYGISKVAAELWSDYYFLKYRVDARGVRYPGIISNVTLPGGGTTDYAVEIYHKALSDGHYTSFLKEGTYLPMMYMDDAVKGTIALMEAPSEKITIRTSYNFSAISFTPAELVAEIKKISPDFKVTYKPDARQQIAESWPQTIDDSKAREDWGWREEFDINKMTQALYEGVKAKLNK